MQWSRDTACGVSLGLIIVAGLLGNADVHAQQLAALASADDVANYLVKQQQKVKALYVKVRVSGRAVTSPEDVEQYLKKAYIPDEVQEFAFRGEKRLSKLVHSSDRRFLRTLFIERADGTSERLTAEKAKRLGISEMMKLKSGAGPAAVYDGREIRRYNPQRRPPSGMRMPAGSRVNQFRCKYLSLVGFYVSDPTAPRDVEKLMRDTTLPHALQVGQYSFTRLKMEGHDHALLEGTRHESFGDRGFKVKERIWLDFAHSLMLVKHEYLDPETEKVGYRVTCFEPVPILESVYIPRRVVVEEFSKEAPDRLKDSPLMITELTLLEWRVNEEVHDSLFAMIEFGPGTVVQDGVAAAEIGRDPVAQPLVYEMPADRSLLDETIEAAKRGRPAVRNRARRVGLVTVLSLLAVGAAWVALRWRRKRGASVGKAGPAEQ